MSDDELAVITVAAARERETLGAFIAAAAIAVARGEIAPLPVDERERLRELMNVRAQLTTLASALTQVPPPSAQPDAQPDAPGNTGPPPSGAPVNPVDQQRASEVLAKIEDTVRRLDQTVAAWLRALGAR